MLKSHKALARWYEPLEPDDSVEVVPESDGAEPVDADVETPEPVAEEPEPVAETPDAQPEPEPEPEPEPQLEALDLPAPQDDPELDQREYDYSTVTVAAPETPTTTTPQRFAEFEPKRRSSTHVNSDKVGDIFGRDHNYSGNWDDWVPGGDEDADEDDHPVASVTEVEPMLEIPVRPTPRRAKTGRFPLAVIGATVALILVAAFGAWALLGRDSGGGTPAAPVPSTEQSAPAAATASCAEKRDGGTVESAVAGGKDSGLDAILWFQHSFYVERSAARAREVVAPDAPVPDAPSIQTGIDSIPPGTTHCLQISDAGGGRFAVDVVERRPDGTTTTYKQSVTTTVRDGRTLITGIAPG